MTEFALSAKEEWRHHWPLVVAASLGFSFVSFMAPALGVFMAPLGAEFGWSRTELSAGIATSALFSILFATFIGALIDRWGVRRLALPGLVMTALSISAFATANGSFTQWMILWVVWGMATLFIQSSVWSTAVAGVFSTSRGLALGFTFGGAAVGQIVAPPLANWLITSFGWRSAFFWLGLGWGTLALVATLFFLVDVHELKARRQKTDAKTDVSPTAPLPGLSIAQAWRDSSLWRIAIATFLILSITIAVTVHQFEILVEAGVTRDHAAWLASLGGFAGIAGKLLTGALIDKYHARWVGGITLASTAIAYPLLINSISTPLLLVIGMMISGYAAGTKIQLCGFLTSKYAGLRNFGTIFGFMTSIIALASAVGPLSAGMLHDRFGSYAPFLIVGVIVSLISGALIFSLGRYPDWGTASK